ncbi:AraC family transcriptional regulator [Amycolatopsis rhabdoformis]|uniref:AraC family transcriptional regulator n=1 Tax=Amycolatopsis rhabdoformis TaxID=1448059 RepID=A0ABZ1IGH4_9PSEU|nr:AraC family transcriptional regulator [Amycolatopsis rhabdoformis]WSE33571.1 AraC family transcriptional regulator [Amycolatopsis rhabdoformis]
MTEWSLVVPRGEVTRAQGRHVFGASRVPGVLTYAAHDFPAADAMAWRVTPLGAITLVLDLEAPVRTLPSSPVLGLRDRPLLVSQGGPARGITVALAPAAAHALFGIPLRLLANTSVGASDLLGREVGLLTERLVAASGWSARFTLLDDFLRPRVLAGPALAAPVQAAWQRLTSGPVRVDAVASELGWTRQHLTARFREDIGLSPKTVGRIARLHRAVSLLPSARSWADLALRCGYADQSHLNRDFRGLTDCTPTEFLTDNG